MGNQLWRQLAVTFYAPDTVQGVRTGRRGQRINSPPYDLSKRDKKQIK